MLDFHRVQSWTKGWRQIHKIKQTSFYLSNVLQLNFRNFLPKNFHNFLPPKLGFWLGGRVLAIKSKHFRDFLEIP